MLSTMIRACPSTHQRPSPENRVSRESNLYLRPPECWITTDLEKPPDHVTLSTSP